MGHTKRARLPDGRKVDVYVAATRGDGPGEVSEEIIKENPNHRYMMCQGCDEVVVVDGPTLDRSMQESGMRSTILVVYCIACLDYLAYMARQPAITAMEGLCS